MYDNYIETTWFFVCKSFVIIILSILICAKILGCRKSKVFIIGSVVFSSVLAVLYYFLSFIPDIYIITSIVAMTCAYIFIFTRTNFFLVINSTFLSYATTYVSFMILNFITAVVMYLFNIENFYIVAPIPLVAQIALAFIVLSHIRSNTIFTFLNKRGFDFIGIVMSIIVLVLYTTFQNTLNNALAIFLFVVFVLITLCIVAWIIESKKTVTKDIEYKKDIDNYISTIDSLENRLDQIKLSNYETSIINHQYSHKITALQESITDLRKLALNGNLSAEFSKEIAAVDERIAKLKYDFDNETSSTVLPLPKVGLPAIDAIFEYQQKEAIKHNINFCLEISGNPSLLINDIIDAGKMEVLIADHIKNAIIAIRSNNKSFNNILVTLGEHDEICYFNVTDTGVPFEIDTLLKLGTEPITTHNETGGTGLGFITTFRTLKECKASLMITDHNPDSKTVSVLFDGKNTYTICSYRADEILAFGENTRIIIKSL